MHGALALLLVQYFLMNVHVHHSVSEYLAWNTQNTVDQARRDELYNARDFVTMRMLSRYNAQLLFSHARHETGLVIF